MKTAKVLSKLEAEANGERNWKKREAKSIIQGFKFMTRSEEFRNSSGTCAFSAKDFSAHSYSWYVLAKRISGVNVLNSYVYANQTAKHIGKVRSAARILGIQYKDLEAPKGLQDLKSSLIHVLSRLSEEKLRLQHSRSPKDKSQVRSYEAQLKLLERLGVRASKRMHKNADANARQERADGLGRQNFKRRKKVLEDYLENEKCFRDYEVLRAERYDANSSDADANAARILIKDFSDAKKVIDQVLSNFSSLGHGTVNFYV